MWGSFVSSMLGLDGKNCEMARLDPEAKSQPCLLPVAFHMSSDASSLSSFPGFLATCENADQGHTLTLVFSDDPCQT